MLFSPYPAVEAKLGQRKWEPRFSIQNPFKVSQSGKDPPRRKCWVFLENRHGVTIPSASVSHITYPISQRDRHDMVFAHQQTYCCNHAMSICAICANCICVSSISVSHFNKTGNGFISDIWMNWHNELAPLDNLSSSSVTGKTIQCIPPIVGAQLVKGKKS